MPPIDPLLELEQASFFVSIATFIILVSGTVHGWMKKRRHYNEYSKLISEPVEMQFYIPSRDKYQVSYEIQDADEHAKNELNIPAHVTDFIFLLIKPKLNFHVTERYFGFKGTGKKPDLIYTNPFKLEGYDSVHWYRDWDGFFHFKEPTLWIKDEVFFPAFQITTYDAGKYVFQAFFHVHSNEFKDVKEEKHALYVKQLNVNII